MRRFPFKKKITVSNFFPPGEKTSWVCKKYFSNEDATLLYSAERSRSNYLQPERNGEEAKSLA
jgi:hypothetical protein